MIEASALTKLGYIVYSVVFKREDTNSPDQMTEGCRDAYPFQGKVVVHIFAGFVAELHYCSICRITFFYCVKVKLLAMIF